MTGDDAEEFRESRTKADKARSKFIGLRIEQATELAHRLHLDLRVIRIHEDEWHTSDLRSNRVTVEVEDGVVTRARAE